MTILITGSLGLIGTVLKKKLDASRDSYVELDVRFNNKAKKNNDIRSFDFHREDLKNIRGVVHLAGISRIAWGEIDPQLCYDINVEGTARILEFCKTHPNKPWLIHASSREVYGQQKQFPVLESASQIAANAYARTKIESEKIAMAEFDKGMRGIILRFSNVYGGLSDHFDRVIPSFVINAINNDDLMVCGPDCVFDFTHVDDVIDGILLARNHLEIANHNNFGPIHFTTGVPTSLEELAELIISITDSKSGWKNLPKRTYSTCKFWGDNSLARRFLGWSPKISLKNGLKDFISKVYEYVGEDIYLNNLNKRDLLNENFKSYTWLPSKIQRRV